MTTGSLGLRSASYGSLPQHLQNSTPIKITPPLTSRKASKMFKEKDSLFHWVFKFVPRKKVGMLLLCVVSIAAMLWVFYVGKGEVASEVGPIHSLGINTTSDKLYSGYSPTNDVEDEFTNSSVISAEQRFSIAPPPPPTYFTGYALPPGNPCETFTLPPPPADKKRTGPRPCPVCYLPVDEAIALMPKAPSFSPVLKELSYIHEKNSVKTEFGGSEFGGYPSLKQRLDSYDIKESMCVHCGFVKGDRPGHKTGFDIDVSDLDEMDECRGVVVASAIFGAYDIIQQPKNISDAAKKKACFVMFVDEETEKYLRNTSDQYNGNKIGLWRVVVVRNLPYTDPRRNGKIPKLLLHRLFPNVRYSVWIDGKLELVVDPFQILERFLWRQNVSFAISRHYRRFDVFIEAEANKIAAKYDNASIDFQIEFYKMEGLTPYSEAKLPITSGMTKKKVKIIHTNVLQGVVPYNTRMRELLYGTTLQSLFYCVGRFLDFSCWDVSADVPEGCVLIREHTPITNLFSCLWFNEVDRFTSRDQISFSTVRDKIYASTNFTIYMFRDCERRNFVVQGYHRDILEHWGPPPPPGGSAILPPPPPLFIDTPENKPPEVLPGENIVSSPVKKVPGKRGRERRSRRHRKEAAGSRDNNPS